MTKCLHHQRHWFTYYGEVGVPSPVCVRCGAPNPRYTPDEETSEPRLCECKTGGWFDFDGVCINCGGRQPQEEKEQ